MISIPAAALSFLLFGAVEGQRNSRGRSSEGSRQKIPEIEYTSVATFGIALGRLPNGQPRQVVGDIEIGLFDNYAPWTTANFAQLAFGGVQEPPNNITRQYEGSAFHRVVPGFVIQGGDITTGDGRGGYSIYGRKFEDENFNLQHYGQGWVSMANSGPDTNNSQFFITLAPTPSLNGKHVVFGKVIKGMRLIRALAGLPTNGEKPQTPIIIYKSSWRKLPRPVFTPLAGADPNS